MSDGYDPTYSKLVNLSSKANIVLLSTMFGVDIPLWITFNSIGKGRLNYLVDSYNMGKTSRIDKRQWGCLATTALQILLLESNSRRIFLYPNCNKFIK